jgi:NAD(P)-dependent dehydrogenase (short-subunit alcohol dehydrogenase family)
VPRVYAVTGSASGIGAAVRHHLETRGDRVIGIDLRDAEVTADLSTPDGRSATVEGVRAATDGRLDALIASAGLSAGEPITVRVNFFGVVATLEGLRPLLAESEAPRAVALSSTAANHPVSDDIVEACLAGDEEAAVLAGERAAFLNYSSSKRALSRWIRRTAPTSRWAGAGIALNAIAPGVVITPMTRAIVEDPNARLVMDQAVPMPYGGHARPEDLAPLLAFLTGPENTHVTGQIVYVDGGTDAVVRGDAVW